VHFVSIMDMDVGNGWQGGVPPWIFIHGTNIVDRGLILLFFDVFAVFRLFFSIALPPEEA